MIINQLTIDNITYQTKELFELSRKMVINPYISEWKRLVFSFLLDWMDDSSTITLPTSGTTGISKQIPLSKEAMIQSAIKTLDFFNLHKDNTIALCLSSSYIAGAMIIVRAIVGELNLILITPSRDPWNNIEQSIDFISVVPMQLTSLLQHKDKFDLISKILVGGVSLNSLDLNKFQQTNVKIYQSFGMTETLSHVAIKDLNIIDRDPPYIGMKGICFSIDENQCLIIKADYLDNVIKTNDVVKLLDNRSFHWIGRNDNVINSGGIKLFPEEIENKISSLISHPYFISSINDEILNQKIILFIEKETSTVKEKIELLHQLKPILNKYEVPKEIIYLQSFQRTKTGKIKREETRKQYLLSITNGRKNDYL